jgi:pimeloyl-ACP methyl ester carboxylesterase
MDPRHDTRSLELIARVFDGRTEGLTRGDVLDNKLAKGGHCAAWEQPQLFSEEVRAAFHSLR